ncbi:MAG: flagellar protein FlgN [Chloroflexi bacterium]|nr:flagellar protein FlgN [Chloroflexota bacterium]
MTSPAATSTAYCLLPTAYFSDLLAILDAQLATYQHLRHIAEERRAALADADVDHLAALVAREQPLLSHARKLEAARLQVLRPIAAELNTTPDALTVSRLCALTDPATATALQQAKDRLLEHVAGLSELNRNNADLLQACLDSVNASLEQLLQVIQLDPRYAGSGTRATQPESPRLTDMRA